MTKRARTIKQLCLSIAGLLAVALLVGACGDSGGGGLGGTTASAGARVHGGTVLFAEPSGQEPNYILPVLTATANSAANSGEFIPLMWKPLYTTYNTRPLIDYPASIGNAPVFSDGDRRVTFTMKHFSWSDGAPVTARDVIFFLNIVKAAGPNWAGYTPNGFPGNLVSYTATGKYTVSMQFSEAYSPVYIIDSDLSTLSPIPQHVWDKTSASGPVGDYDETAAGARKVWKFLYGQAQHTQSYTTNPLWKVIDGPWKLDSFGGAASPDIFTPNRRYSGRPPYIAKFEEVPYTSDDAEFNVLRSGTSNLTVGYVPPTDVPAKQELTSQGFDLAGVRQWAVSMIVPNLTNPVVGAVLRQLYIRQALQHLVDQQTMIKSYMAGYGTPTYGPTPLLQGHSPFVSSAEKTNPYPYSVSDAVALLRQHHWSVTSSGTDTCLKGGPSGCGAGIATGQPLHLVLYLTSGDSTLTNDATLYQSDASKAGVKLQLQYAPFNTVVANVDFCNPKTQAASVVCKWQLGEWGNTSVSLYPTGDILFLPGAGPNAGSYDSPTLDKLINKTIHGSSMSAYYEYENYAARNLPWIWQPQADEIMAYAKNLHGSGITGEFALVIDPQNWYFTKSSS